MNSIKVTLRRYLPTALLFIVSVLFVALYVTTSNATAAQATLSWAAPTNFDGTPMVGLNGYKLHLGSASGSYSQNIDVGNVTSYTVNNLVDGTTYYFTVTDYDSSGNESDYSNQVSYSTVVSPPASSIYTLTASAGSGGTITPSGAIAISQGLNQSFTITPATGFKVAAVNVDGASVGSVTSYTFSNVTADHTISASFVANSYTITASASTGGSISPVGSQSVAYGTSKAFTITPAAGYSIAGVTVDGVAVGAVAGYTFSNVTANHTISASFAASTTSSTTSYSISATAGTNGTITPAGSSSVTSGASKSYTITPNPGYYVVGVVVDGTTVVSNIPDGGYTYAFNNVTTNHTISATFAIRSYHITATAGIGGSVSPADVWILYNTSQTVTVTPGSGYRIADVKVDGISVGAVSSYTFSGIAANHTVSATFIVNNNYTITATAGTNGTISPSGTVSVVGGSSKTFTITPNKRHSISNVIVDGVSKGAVTSFTFSNIAANHTIQAQFK